MLYIKCPTCNRYLADKVIIYEAGLKKICDDVKLSPKEQKIKKMELIDSLKIPHDRYCCRMRLITYQPIALIVK
jgi:DNA-directed RNA polymerase subunit N (RpoN/RPB10)